MGFRWYNFTCFLLSQPQSRRLDIQHQTASTDSSWADPSLLHLSLDPSMKATTTTWVLNTLYSLMLTINNNYETGITPRRSSYGSKRARCIQIKSLQPRSCNLKVRQDTSGRETKIYIFFFSGPLVRSVNTNCWIVNYSKSK